MEPANAASWISARIDCFRGKREGRLTRVDDAVDASHIHASAVQVNTATQREMTVRVSEGQSSQAAAHLEATLRLAPFTVRGMLPERGQLIVAAPEGVQPLKWTASQSLTASQNGRGQRKGVDLTLVMVGLFSLIAATSSRNE